MNEQGSWTQRLNIGRIATMVGLTIAGGVGGALIGGKRHRYIGGAVGAGVGAGAGYGVAQWMMSQGIGGSGL